MGQKMNNHEGGTGWRPVFWLIVIVGCVFILAYGTGKN